MTAFIKFISSDPFRQLFFKNESVSFLGRKFNNLITISVILLLTFIALGMAIGSLAYLREKMDSPFINTINISFGAIKNESANELIHKVHEGMFEFDELGVTHVEGYYDLVITPFFDDGSSKFTQARTIDIHSPLMKEIFSKRNLIAGGPFKSDYSTSMIITSKLAEKTGASKKKPFIHCSISANNDSGYVVATFPVTAIVKSLPDRADLMTTHFFRNQYMNSDGLPRFRTDRITDFSFFIADIEESQTEEIEAIIKFIGQETNLYFYPDIADDSATMMLGVSVHCLFEDSEELQYLDYNALFHGLQDKFDELDFFRIFNYSLGGLRTRNDFDNLDFRLKSLSKLDVFRKGIYDRYGVEVDMTDIESRNNYYFISTLTIILSTILILFASLSLIMFTTNMLTTHLRSIQKNIGTLLAFGIESKELKKIYIRMLLAITGFATFIAYFFAFLIGLSGIPKWIFTKVLPDKDIEQSLFDITNIYVVLVCIVLLSILYFVLSMIAKNILSKRPGDLIYERSEANHNT